MLDAADRSAQEWGQMYADERERWKSFTKHITALVERLLAASDVDVVFYECRAKTVPSLIAKLAKENARSVKTLADIPDLAGVRVVTPTSDEVAAVVDVLREEFVVTRERPSDHELNGPDHFGYRSTHLVVRLCERREDLPEWRRFKGLHAEVQIRSALAHAWASLAHWIDYKAVQALPPKRRRELHGAAATLEMVDDQLARLRAASAALEADRRQAVERRSPDVPLDALTLGIWLERGGSEQQWTELAIDCGFRRLPDQYPRLRRDRSLDSLACAIELGGITTLTQLEKLLGERHPERDLRQVCELSDAGGWRPFALAAHVVAIMVLVATGATREKTGEIFHREGLLQAIEQVGRGEVRA